MIREYIIKINENDLVDSGGIKRIEGMSELVRCKDCKHYDPDTQSCNDGLDGIFLPDWFCADGKRKD